jgi:Sporulation and spore germination
MSEGVLSIRRCRQAAAVCVFVYSMAVGCQKPQAVTPPALPAPPGHQTPSPPPAPASNVTGSDKIKTDLEAMIEADASADHVFPKGVRILSIKVSEGAAYVNFSKEFSALANSGESTESAAQKMLRKVLAGEPGIERLSVSVEGHAFDSQATDWSIPFPVTRVSGESADPKSPVGGKGEGKKPEAGAAQ